MTGLALSLLLVVPVSELTPPPLVPAPRSIDEAFDEPVAPPPPRAQSAETEASYGNPSQRVFITALSAAATSAVTFGVALWLNDNMGSNNSFGGLLPVLAAPLTLMVTAAVATGVHRKLDGLGSFSSHIAGTAIGGALALVVWGLSTNLSFSGGTTTRIGVGTAAALLAGLGAALMGELSHWRGWNENHPEVALVPMKGGASASFGWSF